MTAGMPTPTPYADIGARLEWHRVEIARMSQADYAKAAQVGRSTYTSCETGAARLSLNAALQLRERFGVSLDWLYTGNADTLPMALRNAWLSRSRDSS